MSSVVFLTCIKRSSCAREFLLVNREREEESQARRGTEKQERENRRRRRRSSRRRRRRRRSRKRERKKKKWKAEIPGIVVGDLEATGINYGSLTGQAGAAALVCVPL